MSGFQNAGVTKGIMVVLGITTLTISLLGAKPYAHLQLVPHITKYRQYFRVPLHPFAFANSTELLVGELLLYHVGRGIERSFGARKYASFAVVSTAMSAVLCCTALVFLHRFGLNVVPAGPYGLIFALLWQYTRTVPSLYTFKVCGIGFSSKMFVYILAAQLASSWMPGSILAALAGLVTGYLYRTDTPFLLPSLSRPRRLWRPLKAYRIPDSVFRLLERIFSPLVGSSTAPRRSTRVLPGQVRDGREGFEGGIRGLLAARAGLDTPARAPETGTTQTPGGRGARAAVGEWVTGRGGARAPTEAEITAISSMFPNLSRDAIVQALQRHDYNTALAVEALLEQGG
ncbi:hypothetical protein CspeluHIS016_0406370 [Cutaneotrichosporon spelunceum]|uniref:CUE domain-containing protein n=1 Tax=Cutaneotrichosporon spelunceum TaxID=1672016 RepID=A0AAD3YD47_9TREE|nr:hypothetical protein CspeluHIS016_0406370 [Cutaneotrichosporon spelunceum]